MSRRQAKRVFVVEDEPLFRSLLCTALARDPSLVVAGAFADGTTAIAAASGLAPDVALLDLDLGVEPDGLRAGLAMRRRLPAVGLVLLSNHACPRLLTALPSGDARGWSYLLKRSAWDADALRQAVHGAAGGRVTLDPALVSARFPCPGGRLRLLTQRQRELVELLAMGWSNARIADHVSVSPRSVENQMSRIYAALGVERTAGALNPRVRTVLIYLEESYEGTAAPVSMDPQPR